MKAKEMMKKLMTMASLAGASALPMAAQAEATYDYMATVCVSHYADKDPTASDDHAKWYSVYCLTQEAAQQAIGTTDAVDYKTYAAWLGENFEANKQKTIEYAQLVDLDYFERVVKNKYYFFSYYDTFDVPESPLSDALGVVFFDDGKDNLAYNVLANKEGEREFNCDEEDENSRSSGWKAVTPAAPTKQLRYVAPVYVDGVAANGIDHWTTNAVPSGFAVVESAAARVTWGTAGKTSWYVVTNGTLQIDGGVQCKGYVNLVLCDGAKLTVTNVANYNAGIATDASGSFTIYGTPEGAGELSATAGRWYGAGIGGGDMEDGSHITINGGTVTATGGSCGAGIGGGEFASGTDIVINGGVVYAKCIRVDGGAGIGGGYWGAGTDIVINDGVVYAEGGFGNAAIGGGSEEKGSDIAINGGKVSVFTVISMNYVGTEKEKAEVGDFIGSGNLADAAENVSIADSASVCFNLSGVYRGSPPPYKWIEEPAPSPKDFEGFVIMTPSTQRVDCVLVGGVKNWTAAKTFALTNAVTGATGEIVVNGEGVAFANKLLSLPHIDNKLMLTAERYSMINPPTEVEHTTAKVYTNAVEDATLVETPILVRKDAAAYVVYTADDGYVFADGNTAVTNTIDTSVNPATAEAPAAPTMLPRYVAPVYVDNIASNGIAYWTTNTIYNYTVVESATSRMTWGESGSTSWYVVTNGTYQIDGGVECKGYVNLVLCDGAKLTVTNVANYMAGIQTDASGSFTIYGTPDGAGELDVTSGYGGAGIGGSNEEDKYDGSHITINGGVVTAVGAARGYDSGGAGIGGGYYGAGSDIVINGGVVRAKSVLSGAGIGGGYHTSGLGIVINGGDVYAEGVSCGAGIGGGSKAEGRNIVVNGGVIVAKSSEGAGVGGGYYAAGTGIVINDGDVTAESIQSGAGIGGGVGGCGSDIAINGGEVSVCAETTVFGKWVDLSDLIGSGNYGAAAENVTIADSANVCFNLTGVWDWENEEWIEEPAASPKDFDGFVIMTPETQTLDRVLVGGVADWTAATTFALTNAVTGATDEIEVNGSDVVFAGKLLALPHEDSKLTLAAANYSMINPPTEVANTTATVYTNAVEDATLVETPIVVRRDAAAYVVYTAADGYVFADGTTAKTNAIDTSVNPATAETPVAPKKLVQYLAPVYVDNVASNGIAYWTTNTIYNYTVVESAASRMTWGTAGAESWYAVLDGNVQIDGGVQCAGDVNLVLCDGGSLTATGTTGAGEAGITVSGDDNSLVICAGGFSEIAGTGALTATGSKNGNGYGGAGIGGNASDSVPEANGTGSHITINGGVVTATGGKNGAGIGGGLWASGYDITVNGGRVVADSGTEGSGAGIGGGLCGDGRGIVINGGVVTATARNTGAGIGGGYPGTGSQITITDGQVDARCLGSLGAGIGGSGDMGFDITIRGGDVTAMGSGGGAGIGGGANHTGSNITIRAGTVTAFSQKWQEWSTVRDGGAGIGGGRRGGAGVVIAISGGTVTAAGSGGGAGIGGGVGYAMVDCTPGGMGRAIAISGGNVTAVGSDGAAAIGGGSGSLSETGDDEDENARGGDASDIAIGGGTVWVRGGSNANYGGGVCIGAGGGYDAGAGTASGVTIAAEAKVMFDLTSSGLPGGQPLPAWDGFSILTPDPAVERTLMGGCGDLVEVDLPAFTLRKTEQERTKEIEINGESVPFASKMLTLTNDVAEAGVLKLTVGELPADPVVQAVDKKTGETNTVEVAVPQSWREERGVQDEDVVDTVNTNRNGLLTWQSYVLGLDPTTNKLAGIYADTPQNAETNTVRVETKALETMVIRDGYMVKYRLDTKLREDEEYTKGTNQTVSTFDVPIDDVDPTGVYRVNIVIFKTNNIDSVEIEQGVESVNTVGMLKQAQSATNAIISVPWSRLAPGTNQWIAVSNVVKTATLDEGDELRVYRPGKTNYVAWVLNADKRWQPANNVTENNVFTSEESEDATIPKGSGIWLCRKDPSKPYYLYGQYNDDETEVTVTKGSNLIGATGIGDYDLNEHVKGAKDGDTIVVPGTNDTPKVFTYKEGAWGYLKATKVKKGNREFLQNTWTTEESVAPAGTGFWLHNNSGKVEVE